MTPLGCAANCRSCLNYTPNIANAIVYCSLYVLKAKMVKVVDSTFAVHIHQLGAAGFIESTGQLNHSVIINLFLGVSFAKIHPTLFLNLCTIIQFFFAQLFSAKLKCYVQIIGQVIFQCHKSFTNSCSKRRKGSCCPGAFNGWKSPRDLPFHQSC